MPKKRARTPAYLREAQQGGNNPNPNLLNAAPRSTRSLFSLLSMCPQVMPNLCQFYELVAYRRSCHQQPCSGPANSFLLQHNICLFGICLFQRSHFLHFYLYRNKNENKSIMPLKSLKNTKALMYRNTIVQNMLPHHQQLELFGDIRSFSSIYGAPTPFQNCANSFPYLAQTNSPRISIETYRTYLSSPSLV